MVLANEIRKLVCAHYIKPARERGDAQITIVSGNIHARMGLVSRMPAVCNALRSRKLQGMCKAQLLKEIRRPGVKLNSSTNRFIFELNVEPAGTTMHKKPSFVREPRERMAPKAFEDLCKEEMSRHFKVSLTKGRVSKVPKEFDMTSSDGEIVGDAKYLTMVKGERLPPAKFSMIAEHVWILEKTHAIHKFLVFGNDPRVPKEWLKRYSHLVHNVTFFFLDEKTRTLERLN